MSISDFFIKPAGEIEVFLHNGGTYDIKNNIFSPDAEIIDHVVIPNLIVFNASVLMAARMAPGSAPGNVASGGKVYSRVAGENDYIKYGITHLAIGTGSKNVDPSVTSLQSEVYRKKFDSWVFINESDGMVSENRPTNILKLSTTFQNEPHIGSMDGQTIPIREMGLFGGVNDLSSYGSTSTPINVENTNGGIMFNYKAFDVWNKPYNSKLTINWKITF